MPRKDIERLWIGGTAIVGLLMVLIGYFAFIAPQRSQTRDVNAQVADVTAQNAALSNKVTQLSLQNRDLAKYKAQLVQARLALPSTSGLPDFLRTLQSIGAATNTDTSLTFAAPSDVTNIGGTSTSTPDLTVGGAHIYALPITAQVTGSVSNLNAFLTQLQSVQPRAVLISQITETTGPSSGSGANAGQPGLSLTMQAFVAPSDQGEAADLAAAAQK
jgi:Tfp pilus assembly protein PilO